LKDVITERNLAVLSFTALAYLIFMQLWMPYWSLYLVELGATKVIIGALTALQTASQAVFQLFSGVLADRIGRKKCIVYGTIIRIVTVSIYIFSNTWELVAPGMVLYALGSALIITAKYPAISESLPPEKRGTALGYHSMILSLPRMFMPFLGGIYMDLVGVANAVRVGFILQLIASIGALIFRIKYVEETLETGFEGRKPPRLAKDFAILFKQPRSVLIMLVVGAVSAFSLRMAFPFLVLYAVDVIGFSNSQWGLIQSALGLMSVILSLPGGIIADKWGRKPLIFLSRFLNPFQRLGLVLLRGFAEIFALHLVVGVAAGLGGAEAGVGGPAWNALLADLVPSKDRAKVTGLMALISGFTAMPASIMGGYIWTESSPDVMLMTSFITGAVAGILLLIFVKEPKEKQT
jgi:MFS family permease